jgi:glycosyltransferase involved in cell wall biosynthesis
MQAKRKEILFIVQYPENVSPAQRFRFELYKNLLQSNGFNVTTQSFIDKFGYQVIFKKRFFIRKLIAVLKGFFRSILLMFTVKRYAYILLQYGVAPLGYPIFEWILVKILKKKIIYDFDDAIWIYQFSERNMVPQMLRKENKVSLICKWSYKISCGNDFLCNYAKKYNQQVVYNPTCVDTEKTHNILANHHVQRITLGWTGSFSTLKYLYILEPVFYNLQKKYDFDIKIICNQQPNLKLKNVQYVEWTAENEVAELATCQIGLMPLTSTEWDEGKCGFKLIQYLSLGIPAIASPVGVNKIIVEEGINGYFANTALEWYKMIEKLMADTDLRIRMGKAGREKIEAKYSLRSNGNNFLSLFS